MCRYRVWFDIRFVRIINDHLDFGDALAAGFVCISDGVIAALAAIDVLERVFASGRFELVRAFPAPDFAVPRVRAKSDGRAFFDSQVGRFVPFAVADFHVWDNLGLRTRAYHFLAIADANGIGDVDDLRFKVRGRERLHESRSLLCGKREYGAVARRKRPFCLCVLDKLKCF